jgi:hypothetical protein
MNLTALKTTFEDLGAMLIEDYNMNRRPVQGVRGNPRDLVQNDQKRSKRSIAPSR